MAFFYKWEVGSGTATYKQYEGDNFQGNVATITGLNVTAQTELQDSVTGITVANPGDEATFTIADSLLDTTNHTAIVLTNEGDCTCKLVLASDASVKSTSSVKVTEPSEGFAKVQTVWSAGWYAATNGLSINYRSAEEAETTPLATISGLATTATFSDVTLEAGSSKVVKLAAGAFDQTKDSEITITTTKGYTLTLADGLTAPKTAASDATNPTLGTVSADGEVTVTGTLAAGYTLATGSKKATYTAEKSINLATISGLAANATAENVTFDKDAKTVTLTKDALTTGGVMFTSNADSNYTLELTDAIDRVLTDTKIDAHWTVDGTTATYTDDNTPAKWTLAGDSKSISYTGATAGETLAVITGLASGLTTDNVSSNITIEDAVSPETKNTIKLSATALGTGANVNVQLTRGDTAYKLALADPDTAYAETGPIAIGSVDATGTATITKTTTPGYEATDTAITYNFTESLTLANITGLKKNATTGLTLGTGDDEDKIIVTEAALAEDAVNPAILTNVGTNNYSFTLDESVAHPYVLNDTTVKLAETAVGSDGIATLTGTLKKGWTLDGTTTITFSAAKEDQTLATISGLKADAEIGTGKAVSFADSKIILTKDALVNNTSTTVSIENVYTHDATDAEGTKYTYSLALNGGTSSDVNTLADDPVEKTWKISESKAQYMNNGTAGHWDLASGSISYIAPVDGTEVLAEITGLSSAITAENINGNIDVETVEDDKDIIKLSATALGTGNSISVALGKSSKTNYKLALGTNATAHETSGDPTLKKAESTTTATVEQAWIAGYIVSENADTITYSDTTNETLATVTGLAENAAEGSIAIDATNNKQINLKQAALKNAEVTFSGDNTKNYTLKLIADDGTEEADNKFGGDSLPQEWFVTGEDTKTATFKDTGTAESWTLDTVTDSTTKDKKITYAAASDRTTLAEITGLAADTTEDDFSLGAEVESGQRREIKIAAAALGTHTEAATVATLGESYRTNYKLVLGDDVTDTYSKTKGDPTLDFTKNVDTETTLKTIIKRTLSAGFEAATDGNTIEYKAEGTETLAEITGLANTASDDNVKFGTGAARTTITLSAGALKTDGENNSTVTINDTANWGYKFKLDNTVAAPKAVNETTIKFSKTTVPSGGIITLQAKLNGGWTKTNNTTLTYTAADDTYVNLATISGLKEGTEVGEGKAVYFDSATGKIKLKKAALEGVTGSISITNADTHIETDADGTTYSYALQLIDDDGTEVTSLNGEDVAKKWVVEGTLAKYMGTGTPAHWDLEDGSITYTDAKDGTEVLAVITGLSSDITDDNINANVKFVAKSEGEEKDTITLTATALGTGSVNVALGRATDKANYQLALDTSDSSAVARATSGAPVLGNADASGEATITQAWTAGYIVSDDKSTITYDSNTSETLATITGLAASATAEGITLDNDAQTITLASAKLGKTADGATTKIANAGSNNYKFVLSDANDVTPGQLNTETVALATGTVGADGKATLTGTLKEGWTLTNDTTITYTAEKTRQTLATINGLKTGATIGTDVTYADGKITVTAGALDAKNITIAKDYKGDDYSYTLQLINAETTTHQGTALPEKWVADGTTAKYMSAGTPAHWELVEGTITYTPEVVSTTALAEITGLDGLTAENLGTVISLGTTPTEEGEKQAIQIAAEALGETPGTVATLSTGTDKYKLALGTGANEYSATKGDPTLGTVDGEGATSITRTLSAGYEVADTGNSITYSAKGTEVLANITGLAANATAENVTFNNVDKTVTLTTDALAKVAGTPAKIVATDEGIAAGFTYKFKFDDDVAEPHVLDTTTLSLGTGTVPSTGTLELKGTVEEGWTLNNGEGEPSDTVTYTPKQENAVVATINGLKPEAEIDTAVKLEDKKIILTKDALVAGEGKEITITNVDTYVGTDAEGTKYDYKLALTDGTGEVTTIGGESLTATWEITGDNQAKYFSSGNKEKWTLDADGKVTYTPATPTVLATIEGIKSGLEVSADGQSIGAAEDGTGEYISFSGTEIKLTKDALDGKNVTLTNGKDSAGTASNYSLALDAGVEVPGKKLGTGEFKVNLTGSSSKTATITGSQSAGYELSSDGKTVTYTAQKENVTFATVTGLASGATTDTGANISVVTDAENDAVIVKVQKGALGTATVNLKDGVGAGYDIDVSLAFDAKDGDQLTDNGEGTYMLGFEDGANYWTKSGSTAYYKFDTAQGWTLDGNKITRTANKTTTIATITGLNSSIEAKSATDGAPATIAGITATDYVAPADAVEDDPTTTEVDESSPAVTEVLPTFKLDKSVLGKTNVKLTNNLTGTEYAYKLELNTAEDAAATAKVPTETTSNFKEWAISGTTATYKQYDTEFWTLNNESDSDTITYHEPMNEVTLATIKGLKSGLTIKDDGTIDGIDVTNPNESANPPVTQGTFTLNAKALGTTGVTITSNNNLYKLALSDSTTSGEKVSAPTISGQKWAVASGTATYTGNVTAAGFELKDDGSEIVYTATGTGKVIARVTGLKSSGLVADADGKYIGIKEDGKISEGLKLDGKTITLTEDVLDTVESKKVKVAVGTNYTLDLDEGVRQDVTAQSTIQTDENGERVTDYAKVWRISGTDAIYKKVKLAHYELDETTNEVSYVADKDVKGGTLVTIHNLKSGLKMKDYPILVYEEIKGISIGYDEDVKAGGSPANGRINITEEALGTDPNKVVTVEMGEYFANVKVTDEETHEERPVTYKLYNTSDSVMSPAVDEETDLKWTVEAVPAKAADATAGTPAIPATTTARITGKINAGWIFDDANNTITYQAVKNNATLATITGLKEGLTATYLNNNLSLENNPTALELKADMLGASDVKVTLSDDYTALGTHNNYWLDIFTDENIPYKNNGTELAEHPDVKDENGWAVDSETPTTYTYKTVTPAYYSYAQTGDPATDDDTKIKYTAQADVTDGTIATFTGLKEGLLGTDTYKQDISGSGITVSGKDGSKKITVSKDALDSTKEVTFTASGYSVELDTAAKPKDGDAYWIEDSGKYIYRYDTSDGFVFDDESNPTKITYQKAKSAKTGDDAPTVLAEITGLKAGLTAAQLAEIQIDKDAHTITLPDDVLDGKNITLNSESGYSLALKNASTLAPTSGQTGWKIEDGTSDYKDTKVANLYYYTTAGYTVASDAKPKTITYSAEVYGSSVLATVAGLKSDLSVEAGQIDGIAVNDTVVMLSAGVLDEKDVTISTGYTLALNETEKITDPTDSTKTIDNPDYVAAPKYDEGKWAIKSGTATLTETTSAGYTVDTSDNTKVIYSPEEVLKTTISGLNSSVKTDGKDIGIPKTTGTGATATTTYSGITFEPTESELDPADGGETGGSEDSGATETTSTATKRSGKFTLDSTVLNKTTSTLTNNASGTTKEYTEGNYTIALKSTDEALSKVEDPKWNKTNKNTTATYTQDTSAGYRNTDDGLQIKYSSKVTTETLATVKGLKKDLVAESGVIGGIMVEEPYDEGEYGTVAGTITLDKSVLTDTGVTVGDKDKYELALLDENDCAPTQLTSAYWKLTKNTKTKVNKAELQYGISEGWQEVASTVEETGGESVAADGDPGESELAEGPVKTIKYIAPDIKTVLTIDNLNPDLTVKTDGTVNGLDFSGVTFDPVDVDEGEATFTIFKPNGTILVSKSALTTKDATLTNENGGEVIFELDGDVTGHVDADPLWTADGKGTATYRIKTTAGYDLNTEDIKDGETVTHAANTVIKYTPEGYTNLAKLTGLSTKAVKKTTSDVATIDGITVGTTTSEAVTEGEVEKTVKTTPIKLTDASILGSKVTLTSYDVDGQNYKLEVAEDIAVKEGGEKWYLNSSKGTATYKTYQTAGYTVTDNVATKKDETAGDTAFTVTGLKKNLKLSVIADDGGILVNDTTKEVTVSDAVLGTTKVTLENSGDNKYKFASDGFTTPEAQTPVWTFSSGTANLKQTTLKGFTLNNATKEDGTTEASDTLTYHKQVTDTLAQLTGLNTKLKAFITAEYGNVIGTYITSKEAGKTTYNFDKPVVTVQDNVITISNAALNNKTVTLKKGDYDLVLAGDVNTSTDAVTEWVVSGTTGTYKNYVRAHYTDDNEAKKIIYTKATPDKEATIYAKVTGLNKTTTTAYDLNTIWNTHGGSETGGTLTLNKKQLGTTTVKLTTLLPGNDAFILALDTTNDKTDEKVTEIGWKSATPNASANSSGKAAIKDTKTAGYALAFGQKSITYLKADKASQTVVTVSGIKGSVTATKSSKTVALAESNLNKKNITLTGDIDYKLSIASGVLTAPTVAKAEFSNIKSSSVSVMGAISSEGYIESASEKSVTYTAATALKKGSTTEYKDVSLATIKGISVSAMENSTVDSASKKITLSGDELKEKVTVNGGVFAVEFDSSYNDGAIVGSSKADSISVAGTGVSVTGGKGDDYISLGNGENIFVYSSGDGNDVIADFTLGKDKLKIKSGTPVVEGNGSDIIVKVGSSTIELKNAYDSTNKLTVLNSKGKETEYYIPHSSVGSGYLLADDNYSTSAAQLSDIVKGDSATYTPYEFNSSFSLTKEETFTPTTTSNGSSKKK